MIRSILVVCVGNICRSPVAELLFREHFQRQGKAVDVSSAGIRALVGSAIDTTMANLLPQRIESSQFVSKQIAEEHLRAADLVVVVDRFVLNKINEKWPQYAAKVFLLGHWIGEVDIPDPYRQSAQFAQSSYELIESSVDKWLHYL